MIIHYISNKPREFRSKLDRDCELETKTYFLKECCEANHLMKVIYNHLDNYMYEYGEQPKFLILGVDAYESLSAANHRTMRAWLSDKCMDLDIILDYKDRLNVEVRGSASKDFINYIESKEKK